MPPPVSYEAGKWWTGDAQANAVRVTQPAPGQITLTPEEGTTVNGRADPVTFAGVTRDLVARLGAGDDRLSLGNFFAGDIIALAGNLSIDGGAGNDLRDEANVDAVRVPTFTSFERTAPPALFLGPILYSVQEYVIDVKTADLDGDGHLDLVTVNQDSRSVSVQLGNGGTFAPPVTLLDEGNLGVAVGDFNRDGKADIAVAHFLNALSVFLGNGDGTFQAPLSFSPGFDDGPVATGDFNGAARPRLAAAALPRPVRLV